ncbi:hypothetical protein [Streptomyces sp. 4F14]|uniref:hypothetical protein n=1 Tax=Streptomyces sp. 4F14 TaxID=3394380 RepID=UPI003A89BFB6
MDKGSERVSSWGRFLYERQRDPILWAGGVLQGVADVLGLDGSPHIQSVLRLVSERSEWWGARAIFDQIRQYRLNEGNSLAIGEDQLLRLAEIVAKLAHNASGETPLFDREAGWQIGPIVYRIASEVPEVAHRALLASVLGGWPVEE